MKTVILAKDLMDKDTLLSSSEPENAPIVEIEDEEPMCSGCADDIMISGPDLTEEFVWHPAKKF